MSFYQKNQLPVVFKLGDGGGVLSSITCANNLMFMEHLTNIELDNYSKYLAELWFPALESFVGLTLNGNKQNYSC